MLLTSSGGIFGALHLFYLIDNFPIKILTGIRII